MGRKINVWLVETDSEELLNKARLKYIEETKDARPTNSQVLTKALGVYVNGFTKIVRRKASGSATNAAN